MNQKVQGLHLFDNLHVIYLVTWLIIWFTVPLVGKKYLNKHQQKWFVWIMIVFMVGQEMVDYWNRTQFRHLSWDLDLPLHLCHLSLIFSVYILFRRSQFLFEITYFWGLGGALQTMLTPDMTNFDNYLAIFLMYAHHAMIILTCLWLVVVEGYRTRSGAIKRTFIFTYIVIWPVWLVDWITGGNYMYLMERPPTESPLVFGNWPWYIINIQVVAFLLFNIINLPMILLRKKESVTSY